MRWQKAGRLALANAAGWGNFGDDAIVASIALALSQDSRFVDFYEIGGPAGSACLSPIGAVHSDYGRRGQMALRLARSEFLVIGGGGLLQDHLGPFYRVFARSARLAAAARVPFAVVGVGAYEPKTDAFRRDLEWLANNASHFSVRDAESQRIVSEYGPAPRVVPDPAFALPVPTSRVNTETIGVALRPWWHLSEMWGTPDPGRLIRLVERVADAISEISIAHKARIEAICMHVGTADDDRGVADAFVERARKNGARADVVVPRNYLEAQKALGGCQAVVAMRLHALILSAAQGVPTFAISYDEKVTRVMRGLGRDAFTIDLELRDIDAWSDRIARASEEAAVPAIPGKLRDDAISGLRAIVTDAELI